MRSKKRRKTAYSAALAAPPARFGLSQNGPYPPSSPKKTKFFWADRPVFRNEKQVQIPSSAALRRLQPKTGFSRFWALPPSSPKNRRFLGFQTSFCNAKTGPIYFQRRFAAPPAQNRLQSVLGPTPPSSPKNLRFLGFQTSFCNAKTGPKCFQRRFSGASARTWRIHVRAQSLRCSKFRRNLELTNQFLQRKNWSKFRPVPDSAESGTFKALPDRSQEVLCFL